jgi:hypothetical protein
MQARSTANGKIRREIQNPQMFETDRTLSPFLQQSTLMTFYLTYAQFICSNSNVYLYIAMAI